ncbi:probable leucine-rich repeat receptor-like protein kinase At1g35710 [Hevea brasiliensis]|uniref:probable leucine-rich repeat receptor-like protein kinase At1g35710 n=1 Tax=Hevea brasiliensis TaxID=3981 RepID=UPI0025EABC3B|nr:probable leucine-rich repeat receptor-like protein kinase At1g35710 [Hevea brasiliensis]
MMSCKMATKFVFLLTFLFLVLVFELGSARLTSGVIPALPKEEVSALNAVMDSKSYNYCNDTELMHENLFVVCNCSYEKNTVCHVTKISILNADLNIATINGEVGKLKFLESITIKGTKLSGSIPNDLGNLSALKYLVLSRNSLNGSIPESLGQLRALEVLDLYNNFLTGSIPSSLANLFSLESLDLSYNLLSGQIPQALGNLSNLRGMYLFQNNLSGNIPPELGSLSRLDTLFTGKLPENYANLTSRRLVVQ